MKLKNKLQSFAIVLTLVGMSSSANAKDKVVYDKKTKLDFDGGNVDGQFQTPEGAGVKGDKNLDFDSLLTPRKNFNRETKRNSGAVR